MGNNPIPQAVEELVKAPNETPRLTVIVGIHGIGDQFKFATIQSVATRFCIARENPQALPLGRFYDEVIGQPPETYLLRLDLDYKPGKAASLNHGFVEVYWADIPREPETQGYTIEEAKKWAKTVVDRLRDSDKSAPNNLSNADRQMAKDLLDEIIETIAVLERLLFIAEKAGLFKFDLKEILVKYLGDVQLVTDFKNYRDKILERFRMIMEYIAKFNDGQTDIYIVAHSEGTVVTLLALLEALSGRVTGHDGKEAKGDGNWVTQVKGLMTIGSPIDKHLIFWQDLWKNFEAGPTPTKLAKLDQRIHWRNYYDFGDPIGFELDIARAWLCKYHYDAAFDFPESHDHGFGRYPFPGKAHNDYWTDGEVFNHFIKTVVEADPREESPRSEMCPEENHQVGTAKRSKKRFSSVAAKDKPSVPPPGNRNRFRFSSNVVPYLLVVTLLFLGVYLVYKAVNEHERTDDSALAVFRNVFGIAGVLLGLTLTSQIPRLTRQPGWRVGAYGALLVSLVGYWFIPDCRLHLRLGCFVAGLFTSNPGRDQARASVIILAIAIAGLVSLAGVLFDRRWPRVRLRVLLILGALAIALTLGVGLFSKATGSSVSEATNCKCDSPVAANAGPAPILPAQVNQDAEEEAAKRPLWPFFLAAIAFLYLWWLAALLFDLVVVWHHYIRYSGARKRFREVAKAPLKCRSDRGRRPTPEPAKV